MKKKLIAAVLSITVIAGVGAVVYNTNKDNKNIDITANDKIKIVDNSSNGSKEATDDVDKDNAIANKSKAVDSTNSIGATDKNNTFSLGQDNSVGDQKPVDKPSIPPVEEKPVTPPVEEKPVTPPNETNPQPPVVDSQFMATVEQAIFNIVNQERAKAGVSALSYNNTMQKYARIKSQDMGDRNYFDHSNPEGELITAQMQRDGVTYNAWGENIAYISAGADANALATQFMNNWMNSDGHRKNILSTNFSGIGVGVYKAGNKVYATQEFYR